MEPETDQETAFGRPSPASGREPLLGPDGCAASAGWRADAAASERWILRAASVVGVRHRLRGGQSEDFYAWARIGDGLFLAVSDGVGSIEGSGEAARHAATAAVAARLDIGDVLDGVIAEAGTAAAGGGATTLVVADLDGDGMVRLARVGDSTAFVIGPDGSWQELFEPPTPDRDALHTHALPSPEPVIEYAEARLGSGSVLVVATDGIGDPWRDGPTTVAPALTRALAGPPSAPEMLALADFSRQGCHDDRTLVCVWVSADRTS